MNRFVEQKLKDAVRANERDRLIVSNTMLRLMAAINAYQWLLDGRGPHEYDDDTWRNEFRDALDLIYEAVKPLDAIVKDRSHCPIDVTEIDAAKEEAKALLSRHTAPLLNRHTKP